MPFQKSLIKKNYYEDEVNLFSVYCKLILKLLIQRYQYNGKPRNKKLINLE